MGHRLPRRCLISMAKIHSIATLHGNGHSNREIARLLGIDRGTVNRYMRRLKAADAAHQQAAQPQTVLGDTSPPDPMRPDTLPLDPIPPENRRQVGPHTGSEGSVDSKQARSRSVHLLKK